MFNTSSFNCLLKTTYILLVSSPFSSLVTSRWPLKLKLWLYSKRWRPVPNRSPQVLFRWIQKLLLWRTQGQGYQILRCWSWEVFRKCSLMLDWYCRVLWWCQMDFPETLFLLSPKNLLNRQGLSENCQSLGKQMLSSRLCHLQAIPQDFYCSRRDKQPLLISYDVDVQWS